MRLLFISNYYVFSCCFLFVQASWSSLRTEYAALKPAQLHHMLQEYSSGKACPAGWSPSPDDAEDAVRTGERHRPRPLLRVKYF